MLSSISVSAGQPAAPPPVVENTNLPAAPTAAPAAARPFQPGSRTDAALESTLLRPALGLAPDLSNAPVPMPTETVAGASGAPLPSAAAVPDSLPALNRLPLQTMSTQELVVHLTQQLEMARHLRREQQPKLAEPLLVALLGDQSPVFIQQSALLELAATARDENDLPRAQQIYAQFLTRWPDDPRVPEVLLRQGLLFREMSLYDLALTKFYAVMTSALVLKNDQMDYYARLVLEAQTEIAETNYKEGKYADAADFFARLLTQNNPGINKPAILYKLVRCRAALGDNPQVVRDADEFLRHYADAPELPEVRFHLALALKELGRNNDSLRQVLLLLQEEHAQTTNEPDVWAYWQQRAGNLIANQLYREGDYPQALQIYQKLAQIDSSPEWQLPVDYQIGLTFERLSQPQLATQTYQAILGREKELGTNAPPGLTTVLEMARWRIHFIQWENKAEEANRELRSIGPTNAAFNAAQPMGFAAKLGGPRSTAAPLSMGSLGRGGTRASRNPRRPSAKPNSAPRVKS